MTAADHFMPEPLNSLSGTMSHLPPFACHSNWQQLPSCRCAE